MRSSRISRWALAGPVSAVPEASVVGLVRRQALRRPDALAVESAADSYTYSELWGRITTVAQAVADAGVSPGDLVGVWCDRSPDTIVAALAVMAAGAAYVPFEPTHPAARSRAVAAAAGIDLMLTVPRTSTSTSTSGSGGGVPDGVAATHLDLGAVPHTRSGPTPDPIGPHAPRPEDLAYVIFTSGTTGVPKGVAVEHRSVVNYATWCAGAVGRQGSGSPVISSLAFDLSMTSLWPQLVTGHPVAVSGGVWDHSTLFDRPVPFSYAKVTPSIIRFFERTRRPVYRDFASLLILGGELLEPELIRALGDRVRGTRLMNHYGPTETTIGCCFQEFRADALPALPSIPIGSPIANTRAYVVDDDLAPVAPGRPGELVIAGSGVARGYLAGDPGRSFVDEAELGGPEGRAYRTGDQVEQLAEGPLLFLGRRDDQFKVSGYRVEGAELRRVALAVDGVADVVFGPAGDGDRLDAFVTAGPGARPETLVAAVRGAFAAAFPSAVCPRRVHVVAEIVVAANGKRDPVATARLASGGPDRSDGR